MGYARSRAARVACASVLVFGAALAASSGATAGDLASLRERAQSIAGEVTALERRLAELRTKQGWLEQRIQEGDRRIGLLELELSEAEDAYRVAQRRYVRRAVATYKTGPGASLDLLLSAQSFGDLVAIAQANSHAAQLDSASIRLLSRTKRALETRQKTIDSRKQALLAARREVELVQAEVADTITARRATLEELNRKIQELERQVLRRAAQAARPDQALLRLLGPSGPSSGIPPGFVSTGVAFEGLASWYGPGFEGDHTANGDVFDPDLYTAASRDLTFGTWLYVEHDGRGVVVLINDRGPYIEERILDLSQAAARAIGLSGVQWVRAEILLKVKR